MKYESDCGLNTIDWWEITGMCGHHPNYHKDVLATTRTITGMFKMAVDTITGMFKMMIPHHHHRSAGHHLNYHKNVLATT